jgi:hypothetical protein
VEEDDGRPLERMTSNSDVVPGLLREIGTIRRILRSSGPENFLDALSNPGQAVRLYSGGWASGPRQDPKTGTKTYRKQVNNLVIGWLL